MARTGAQIVGRDWRTATNGTFVADITWHAYCLPRLLGV